MSDKTHDVATPNSEPNSKASLNLESVLRVLDFEIERIVAEQSRPGWTLWALCGALAAIIWLLIEQFTATSLHLVNTLQLFVALSVVMSTRHFLKYLQGFGQTKPARSPRFQWASDSTNRLAILIGLIKNSLIVFIALTVTSGVRWYYSWTTTLIYGVSAFIALAALVLSTFRIPISSKAPRLEGHTQIAVGVALWILCLVMLGSIVFGYLSAVGSSPESISGADVRTALLLVAVTFLLRLLVDDYSSSPLLVSLIQTRRDLAFGRISLNTAIEQAEIAILGMNEHTVLQEDVRNILQSFELINDELVKGAALLETLKSMANNKAEFRQSVRDSIAELRQLESIVNDDLSSRLEKQTKALVRRGRFLGNTPSSRAALAEIMKKVTEARDNSALRVRVFVEKAENVISIIESDTKDLEAEANRLENELLRLRLSSPQGELGPGVRNEQANKH